VATAASNVTVKLTLKGQDRASGVIRKTGRSADRASAGFSKLGKAALAAGAGFAAIAAAGAAVKRLAEMSTEVERLRASMEAVFGPDGLQVAIDTARKIGGVGAESVAKLARTLDLAGVAGGATIEQLQKLTRVATKAGVSGDVALTKLADAVGKGNTRALQQVGIYINSGRVLDDYALSVGKTSTQLTAAEKSQVIFEEAMKAAARISGASTEAYDSQDRALARLDNAWLELKATMSEIAGGDLKKMTDQLARAVEATARWARVLAVIVKVLTKPFVDAVSAAMEAVFALSFAFGQLAAGNLAKTKQTLETFMRSMKDKAKDGAQAWRDLGKAIDDAMLPRKTKAADRIGGGGAGFKSIDEWIRKGEAAQKKARDAAPRRRKAVKKDDGTMGGFLEDEPIHELGSVQALAAGKTALQEHDKFKADLFLADFIRESKADMATAAFHDRDMQRLNEKRLMHLNVAGSIAGSVASIAGHFVEQETVMRVQAGVESAIAFGKALVALGTPGGQAQAAMLFAGSAALAAQAIGGSSRGRGVASGGSRSVGPQNVGASAGGGGGGSTTIVNFNNGVLLGNAHDVGRTLRGVLRVTTNSGF
jgi:hypothetical protein